MTFILGTLYILAMATVIFIGYKAFSDTVDRPKTEVERIAEIQHWEYLRSLKKDGFK